ncbi:uncharacterized protein [Argopecten irradians]|uniref:uncharacterized protein n=1 Tax=Argopecten irradians TaxID=31199 RepID=UPI003720F39C
MEVLESLVKSRVDGRFVECHTLELIACNPFAEDFSNASILTQEKLSTFRLEYDLPETFTDCVRFDQVWDTTKIKQLIKSGDVKETLISQDERIGEAIAALKDYFADVNIHQECLKKVLRDKHDPDESAVLQVLAAHLFGPLSNGAYKINCKLPHPEVCSCGCDRQLKKGNTGLGCDVTWHGFVDMYIQDRISIIVKNIPEDFHSKDGEDWLSSSDDAFSIHKQSYSCLIAQTVTNGFAQVNTSAELSGLPIPSFGCCPKQISIYLYDCKNDILLKSLPLTIFKFGQLDSSTVVMVWLYLNFSLFMNKHVSNLPSLRKANFLKKKWVEYLYSNVQCGLSSFPSPPEHVVLTPKLVCNK